MLWMTAAAIDVMKLIRVFRKWIRSWINYRGAVIHAMGVLLPVKVMPLRCHGRKPCC
jgi:cell division protein FtsX